MDLSQFTGYKLIASNRFADWVQARTHKKKRINKKWRKRYGMKEIPHKNVMVTKDRKIYGHPIVIDMIIEGFKKEQVE